MIKIYNEHKPAAVWFIGTDVKALVYLQMENI